MLEKWPRWSSPTIYLDQVKSRPKEGREALWKEILKGNSTEKHWEDLTAEQRKLLLPMMKNYVVLVKGDLQYVIGETEGPVTRVESIFILIFIAV